MGYVLNPIRHRLGYIRIWCDAWFMDKLFYSTMLHQVYAIKRIIGYLFMTYFLVIERKKDIYYSYMVLYLLNDKYNIQIYLYNTLLYKFQKMKRFLYSKKMFESIRGATYWAKAQVLYHRNRSQRFMIYMTLFGILQMRWFTLDVLKHRLHPRILGQIRRARKRYSFNKNWISREQVQLYKTWFFYIEKSWKFLGWPGGTNYLYKFYQAHFKKHRRSKNLIRSYSLLFYFICFLDIVFRHWAEYPTYLFTMPANLYTIIKIVFIWSVFKPLFRAIEKILYYALYSVVNVKIKFSFYFLDNISVSAEFIARFLARSLGLGYTYWVLINPFKKHLKRLRFGKKFRSLSKDFSWVRNKLRIQFRAQGMTEMYYNSFSYGIQKKIRKYIYNKIKMTIVRSWVKKYWEEFNCKEIQGKEIQGKEMFESNRGVNLNLCRSNSDVKFLPGHGLSEIEVKSKQDEAFYLQAKAIRNARCLQLGRVRFWGSEAYYKAIQVGVRFLGDCGLFEDKRIKGQDKRSVGKIKYDQFWYSFRSYLSENLTIVMNKKWMLRFLYQTASNMAYIHIYKTFMEKLYWRGGPPSSRTTGGKKRKP